MHGNVESKSNHYIDGNFYNNEALDRFKRDYATTDKDTRDKKY